MAADKSSPNEAEIARRRLRELEEAEPSPTNATPAEREAVVAAPFVVEDATPVVLVVGVDLAEGFTVVMRGHRRTGYDPGPFGE